MILDAINFLMESKMYQSDSINIDANYFFLTLTSSTCLTLTHFELSTVAYYPSLQAFPTL